MKHRCLIKIIALLAAFVISMTLFGCGLTDGENNNSGETTKPETPALTPDDIDLTKFLSKAYNASMKNFTLSGEISTDETKEEFLFKLVKNETSADFEFKRGEVHAVYQAGSLYVKLPGGEFKLDEPGFTPWLPQISDKNLEALLDLFTVTGRVNGISGGYEWDFTADRAEDFNALYTIIKENISNKALTGIRILFNRSLSLNLSEEEFTKLILLFGDQDLKTLIKNNPFIGETEFVLFYSTVWGLLKDTVKLPSYERLLAEFGEKSLSQLITGKAGGGQALVDYLNDHTLYDMINRIFGTAVADQIVSNDITADKMTQSFKLIASADFKLKNLDYITTQIMTRNGQSVEKNMRAKLAFSDIGSSAVSLPAL